MASIRDVALHAKVSQATVSRVLNGKGYIAEKTREKVLAACKALNYRLNHSIQDLVLKSKTGATRNIAVVMVGKELSDPVYSRLLQGVADDIVALHYHLMFISLKGSEKTIFDFPSNLRDERVDGILVTGFLNHEVLAALKEVGVPIIVIGDYSESLLGGINNIRSNIAVYLSASIKELAAKGKRRVGLVMECPGNYFNTRVREWFRDSLDAAGLEYRPELNYFSEKPMDGCYGTLMPVFQQDELPFDALVCEDYRLAQEVAYMILGHYGLHRTPEVTVVTNRPYEYYSLPVPAVYFQNEHFSLAHRALNMLVERIEFKGDSDREKFDGILINTNE